MYRFAMLGCLVVLSGCFSENARFVEIDGHGGVVAIPRNTNSWPEYYRDEALDLIEKECPHGYVIEREQEVVVGKTTHTHTHRDSTENPAPVLTLGGDNENGVQPSFSIVGAADVQERTHRTTTTSDQTEWRIYFRKAHPVDPGIPPTKPSPSTPPTLPRPNPVPLVAPTGMTK